MNPLLELEKKEKLEFDRNQCKGDEGTADESRAKKRKEKEDVEEDDEEINLFHKKQVC